MTSRKAQAKPKRNTGTEPVIPASGQMRPPRPARTRRAGAALPVAGDAEARNESRPGLAQRALPPLLLLIAGALAYAGSFNGAFVFDDLPRIVRNADIRQLWPFWNLMANSNRPLVELSFAINFRAGGLDPWGYHAVNLVVHLLAGLVLYGVLRRMFESETLRPRYGTAGRWLALAIALLWIVHPLQTESVTYVIQRSEAMMGLFLLLTLYLVIRGSQSPSPVRWYAAAVIACAAGMASKEVMVVAPLVVLVYDRLFIAPSFKDIFRRRAALYAGLAATWLVLLATIVASRPEYTVGVGGGVGAAWSYAITQFGVIVHYLRLVFWPSPLVLEYSWPLAETVGDILPWALIVGALVAATLWALVRRHWAGFWGAWFFLILAPTSTILPIADPAFEHRMYLPLAAVLVLAIVAGYELLRIAFDRIGTDGRAPYWVGAGLVAVAALGLGVATAARNQDYRSEVATWNDVATKRPDNPRAQFSLGVTLAHLGRIRDAIVPLSHAVRLKPDSSEAHSELGSALYRDGRKEEGLPHLFEAVRLKPDYSEGQNNLAVALYLEGRNAEAVEHYRAAIRADPRSAEAHQNLGVALDRQGDTVQAIAEFREALRIKADYPDAHNNLGKALVRQGNNREAITHFADAVRLNPGFAEARENLRTIQAREEQAKAAKP